jgi:hypothetical protein
LLDGSAPHSGRGDPNALIIYYNCGWIGKKVPKNPESMAGGACISYTGSGPWNKNLNLDGKEYYRCNYDKLMNTSSLLRLARYKILNRSQTGNKYNLLKNRLKFMHQIFGTLSA